MDVAKEIKRRFLLQKEYLGTEKPVNKFLPFISVSVAAYQHENYIRKCLDGILMQQTDYPFEIIIGEDESKDKTRSICIEYANKFPDKIRLFLRDRKISHLFDDEGNLIKRLNGVFGFGRMSARGKYMAVCEGDDYWTDPLKLQKQVDFLEKNKNYAFTFHAVEVKNEVPNLIYSYPIPVKSTLNFNDILKKHYIPTCSLVFKRECFPNPTPFFFYNCLMGDVPFELLLASNGRVYFFKEKMGVYRKNVMSITQTPQQISKGRSAYVYVYYHVLTYLFPRHFFSLSLKLMKTIAGFLKGFIKQE